MDLAEIHELERQEVEQHRLDCLSRFRAAVKDHRRGDKDACAVYLRGIDGRHGREIAEQSRRELVAFAKSGLEV